MFGKEHTGREGRTHPSLWWVKRRSVAKSSVKNCYLHPDFLGQSKIRLNLSMGSIIKCACVWSRIITRLVSSQCSALFRFEKSLQKSFAPLLLKYNLLSSFSMFRRRNLFAQKKIFYICTIPENDLHKTAESQSKQFKTALSIQRNNGKCA